ncbi:hypothetical protein FI667_g14159, partial [Globisporangium splendens]
MKTNLDFTCEDDASHGHDKPGEVVAVDLFRDDHLDGHLAVHHAGHRDLHAAAVLDDYEDLGAVHDKALVHQQHHLQHTERQHAEVGEVPVCAEEHGEDLAAADDANGERREAEAPKAQAARAHPRGTALAQQIVALRQHHFPFFCHSESAVSRFP